MIDQGTLLDIGDHSVEILKTPLDTGDRYFVRIVAQPGAPGIDGDFPHVHPTLIETFTCVSGEMKIRVGGEVSYLPEGEEVIALPGQLHGFVNAGLAPLVVKSEVIFPEGYRREDDLLRFGALYDRLRRDGPTNSRGEPPLLQMAVLAHAYRRVIGSPGLAGVLMPAMAALGRLRGYRSQFPEYRI